MDLVAAFTAQFAAFIALAPCPIQVLNPDGTLKYPVPPATCNATSGVFPRQIGEPGSYDQERLQFTHLARDGEPVKFDQLIVDGVTRTVGDVLPHRVAGQIIAYRIIVEG